jgi:hypothetical protein
MELFPEHVYYYYKDCSLNGRPIVEQISEKYEKYFNAPSLKTNTINHRKNKDIIEQIQKYEKNMEKAKQNTDQIKEELIALALHPNRVAKWIKAGVHLRDM